MDVAAVAVEEELVALVVAGVPGEDRVVVVI